MAPKAAAVGEAVYTLNGVTMTPSDMRLIFSVLNNLTAPLQADLDAAAAFSGYTLGSFKKMWPALKKKCSIDSVSGIKPAAAAAAAADDGNESVVATPKKIPGGRGRSSKKMLTDAPNSEAGSGPIPLTPGVLGMDALSVADGFETPDTPSKSTFGGNTASSKKRTAADILMEETPAKKKAVRKPRITAKQKAEAAKAEAAITGHVSGDYIVVGMDEDGVP
ncbi:hypothetical protein N0V85_003690 [Neurospora sp. IMI 360204]|nr:hypothetical protein N0V85_003690 [Neurospora sp. IMI 360204]